MTTTLSNLSFNNGIYSVVGLNANGELTINKPTTSHFNISYSPWISSTLTHNYRVSITDTTSNINVALTDSNLIVSNQSSNLFSTSITSYITLSNFNVVKINRFDDSISVGLNETTIVRITSSNELPMSFSNSSIKITASNTGQFKDIGYIAIATVDTPMQFNKSVKFVSSVSASNISSPTIDAISSNISTISTKATSASNVAYWSSNTLLNKNSNATIYGLLDVRSNELRVYPPTGDANAGIRLIGNGQDGNSPTNYNGGLASWWGIGFKCQLDGTTRFLHDTRTGSTYMAGSLGLGTSAPAYKLDVAGNMRLFNTSTNIGLQLSNNNSPGIEVNNGSSALNIGVANSAGNYSVDAALHDAVIRHGSKLLLQSGSGASALCINTSNNVGIGKNNPSTKLDVVGVIQNTVAGGADATFTFGQRLKCDASEATFYWRNSNIGFDVYNPTNNLASNKRHLIINEYADATSGFVGIGKSNPTTKLDVNGTISATNYTGATITALSNLVMFSSNTATWASNASFFASNQTMLNNSNVVSLSNAIFNSLTTTQSNISTLSNATFSSITTTQCNLQSLSNTVLTLSNLGTSNTTELQALQSNLTTLSNSIVSTNATIVSYSNYESGRVSSLSNFAYSIQSSNTTTVIYTSNVITKTVSASDGGTIGSLVMSAAGLALGGYNLFNQNGKLVNTLQDTLGNMKLYTNGLGEFQSLLAKTGSYTDSVQIGVSTIELSNNTIYFKNGSTSNMRITSNAITITNDALTIFTISNADIATNCNIIASNITTLSNSLVWTSNNAVKKTGDAIDFLTTNKMLMPSAATIIGAGWDYSNGWVAYGNSNGGFVLRNGNNGSLEIYTGTSNTGLNISTVFTSNGNVGIGTFFPTTKLDVAGIVNATTYTGTTITDLSNLGVYASNNLVNKNTNATINGLLDVRSNELRVYPPTGDENLGIRVIGNGQDGSSPTNYNGGLASWYGIGFKCQLDGTTRFVHDTRTGNTYNAGYVGIGTSNPVAKLDVNGTARVVSSTGAGGQLQLINPTDAESSIGFSNGSTLAVVGLGSYSVPTSSLSVWGAMTVAGQAGNVGVGTSSPSYKLDVASNINIGGSVGWGSGLHFMGSEERLYKTNDVASPGIVAHINSSSNFSVLSTGGVVRMAIKGNTGNVGIGTASPSYKLDVLGNTRLNNALIGDCGFGGNYAAFCHSSSFSTGGYGLLHDYLGETYLNCASGRNINFRINNANIGTWNSSGLKVYNFSGAIGFTVSNNSSPGIEVNNGSSALNLGVASATGNYSSDAATNDVVIRNSAGKLLFQYGSAASAICINTSNNVGIGTASPSTKLDVNGTVNATSYTGTTITDLYNLGQWGSNTARWSSNYGAALCNLGTDAFNKAVYGSNVANWTSNALLTPTLSNVIVTGGLILPRGADGAAGTYTYLPYAGDGKSYIRGEVILADNGGKVGIGTSSPAYLLDVNGTTRTTKLQINNELISYLRFGSIDIGTNVGVAKKTVSVSISGNQPSNVNYVVYLDYQSTNDDIFVGKIRNKATTGFDIVTYRADAQGWGTAPICYYMIIG